MDALYSKTPACFACLGGFGTRNRSLICIKGCLTLSTQWNDRCNIKIGRSQPPNEAATKAVRIGWRCSCHPFRSLHNIPFASPSSSCWSLPWVANKLHVVCRYREGRNTFVTQQLPVGGRVWRCTLQGADDATAASCRYEGTFRSPSQPSESCLGEVSTLSASSHLPRFFLCSQICHPWLHLNKPSFAGKKLAIVSSELRNYGKWPFLLSP